MVVCLTRSRRICYRTRNFLVHSYTCCSDRHASPYWTSIRRWISMGFTPSLRKKRMRERCSSLVHVARGHHLYTIAAPPCCIPPSYCHLSATLQTMSITVANLQDNRAVFRIFYHTFKVFKWLTYVKFFYLWRNSQTWAKVTSFLRFLDHTQIEPNKQRTHTR